jgi:hypothetical protein
MNLIDIAFYESIIIVKKENRFTAREQTKTRLLSPWWIAAAAGTLNSSWLATNRKKKKICKVCSVRWELQIRSPSSIYPPLFRMLDVENFIDCQDAPRAHRRPQAIVQINWIQIANHWHILLIEDHWLTIPDTHTPFACPPHHTHLHK